MLKKENAIFRLQSIDNYLKRQNDYSERNHDAIMMAIYLVTMKGWASSKPMVTTSIFVNSTKEWYPSCIAWMPLPEPYKKEGEAE